MTSFWNGKVLHSDSDESFCGHPVSPTMKPRCKSTLLGYLEDLSTSGTRNALARQAIIYTTLTGVTIEKGNAIPI